jgi:hypothetical protein
MKTIRSIVAGSSHRLPARLKLISTRLGSLLVLFQRMPVVQFLFPEASYMGSGAVANSVSLAVTTVVGLGAFDSVAGVTTIDELQPLAVTGATSSRTAVANAINVPATVSAPLNFEFVCGNAKSDPESWRIVNSGGAATNLPNNLTMTYTTSTPSDGNGGFLQNNYITGTPAQAGIFPVYIRVYRDPNQTGDNVTQLFNLCVLGFSSQPGATPASISSGGTSNLTCTATGVPLATTKHPGNGTLTYQWYRGLTGDDSIPVGTTNSTTPGFTTPALNATTNYWVKLKSVLGASTVYANSNTVTVTVSAPASVVSVAVSPSSVLENSGSAMIYTFTRTGATTSSLTANYTIAGSATAGSDYPSTTGPVIFAAGSATATVSITPTGDFMVEPNETVTMTVAAGSGYTAGGAAANGTITNDDTAYSSWASGLSVSQNGPTQMPMGDGVTNLEKFAFNLEPLVPDVRHLTVGANNSAGLPGGVVVGGKLRLEFLRRRADANPSPGITYTAQFGSELAGWTDIAVGTPTGVAIDGTWERVTVDDPTGGTKRFGRVKVIKAP